MSNIIKFIKTINYLKPIQILWRIRIFFVRILLDLFSVKIDYSDFIIPKLKVLGKNPDNNIYKLFDEQVDLQNIDWNANRDKLKKYHLHYFDFLESCNRDLGQKIINKWLDDNPPSTKNDGWEPYPISLRIINWIFFLSKMDIEPEKKIVESIYRQGKWLLKQREYHLLANHYLKNILAILFWAYSFNKNDILRWALMELEKESEEQFTKEGLHYEFSSTYHAISLKDLMDCYNLLINNPVNFSKKNIILKIKNKIKLGMNYLIHLTNEGKYINIGDVNYQDCPDIDYIKKYSDILKISTKPDNFIISKTFFPFLKTNSLKILLVNTPFSPDYNPAHSHQDKLSIILWYKKSPILVDTGNYSYKNDYNRNLSRSIEGHNTIKLDNYNQAETWNKFRMGYRGKLVNEKINDDEIIASFNHKDYKHTRMIEKKSNGFSVKDILISEGTHSFKQFYHFYPNIQLRFSSNQIIINNELSIKIMHEPTVMESYFFPEMYQKEKNRRIIVKGQFKDKIEILTYISIIS